MQRFNLNRRQILAAGGAMALAGCVDKIIPDLPPAAEGQPLWQPPVQKAVNGTLSTDVRVKYSDYVLAGQKVSLRGYDGLPVGRTLRFRAGEGFRLHLFNDLPWEPVGEACGKNQPHALNTTNMHLHGVHVSPNQPQDYILLNIGTKGPEPSGTLTDYQYVYDIKANHPPGTYFYHAHYHGSVALQVSSGMAGALIIEGEVDDIPEIAACREMVLMVQSQCPGPDGRCESYDLLDRPGPTYINGQLRPRIRMQPGEVVRWRLVNATHDRFLMLSSEPAAMVLLCADGNPLPKATRLSAPWKLVPGNRADLLIRAPLIEGSYVVDGGPGIGTLATLDVAGPRVTQALYEGPLPRYAELTPIPDKEITYGRRLGFGMIGAPPHLTYTINGIPFSCEDPWKIALNSVEEWEITNQTNDPHPFHIHTNPIQMVEGGGVPPGIWLDTVEIPPAHKIRFRTRFKDYTGTMVFHCHTLTHEDMGMMQAITITS